VLQRRTSSATKHWINHGLLYRTRSTIQRRTWYESEVRHIFDIAVWDLSICPNWERFHSSIRW
jgi:hypothetical protein